MGRWAAGLTIVVLSVTLTAAGSAQTSAAPDAAAPAKLTVIYVSAGN